MSVFEWNEYSLIEVTCDAGAVSARCQVRTSAPAASQYSVVDIGDATVAPTTKADAMVKLTAALAWAAQQAGFGMTNTADAAAYSRFELKAFFGAITIVVAGKVNSTIVACPETELVVGSGPFLDSAQQLLEAARSYVIQDKGLS